MANTQEILDRLHALDNRDIWEFHASRKRYTAVAGTYTLHVDRMGDDSANWQVEHERFGVIQPWSPAATVRNGMKDALAFTRAYAQGSFEPKHQDA